MGAEVFARADSFAARPTCGSGAVEETYREFFEQLPLMCFTVATDGTIRSVNAHVVELLGYRRDELVGQSSIELVHPEDLDSAVRAFRSVLEEPGSVHRWELRLLDRNGAVRWVRELNRALRTPDGETLVMAVCEDLTERRQAEQREAAKDRRLRALTWRLAVAEERERRRIARGLHDEVGQALALVKLRLGELAAADPPEQGSGRFEEIERLIHDAIESTRSLTFELSSPVLYEVGLDAALRGLGRRLEREARVHFHFASDEQPRSLAVETRVALYRIGRELLCNVAKHARASSVTVSLSNVGEHVELVVEDDGVGFDASEAGRSFGAAGGFGLFSIRQQLEHIGGGLEIDSCPGTGTRVVAVAPLHSARGAERR